MSNNSESSSDTPVAWFVPPTGQNAPNPDAEVSINQGPQPQSGQGPEGKAWTPPQNQSTGGQAQSTTATDNLFPSSNPLQPKF